MAGRPQGCLRVDVGVMMSDRVEKTGLGVVGVGVLLRRIAGPRITLQKNVPRPTKENEIN